jgi:hypothetical protein
LAQQQREKEHREERGVCERSVRETLLACPRCVSSLAPKKYTYIQREAENTESESESETESESESGRERERERERESERESVCEQLIESVANIT